MQNQMRNRSEKQSTGQQCQACKIALADDGGFKVRLTEAGVVLQAEEFQHLGVLDEILGGWGKWSGLLGGLVPVPFAGFGFRHPHQGSVVGPG
jgi:hypothetical protein